MLSCPDWSRLSAARNNGEAEPESWAEAVAHFDSCSLCRKEALKADPLLVFRRMATAEITPAEERLEVESMQQAVAAMRTARRLETRGRFAGWRRWAAAAVLAGISLGMDRDKVPQLEQATAVPASAASTASAPVLDGIDQPEARVYQMEDGDSSIVIVIDPSYAETLDG